MKNAFTRTIDSNPRVGAQKLRNRMFISAHARGDVELYRSMTSHDRFNAFTAPTKEGRKGAVVRLREQRPAMFWRKFKKNIGQNR